MLAGGQCAYQHAKSALSHSQIHSIQIASTSRIP